MGKSNRIRTSRAIERKSPVAVKKQKKGMPGWLMTLLTLVITIAILGGVTVSLLSANGVFGRMDTVMSTDNYKVNANMMSYYFYTQYSNFKQNYSSYISSILDENKSLKEQYYSEPTDTAAGVTWYDYFMEQTVSSVESILYYCEEAEKLNLTLDDADKDSIQATLDTFETTAAAYGIPVNTYIQAYVAPGAYKVDVKKAMELSALATKCMNHITDDLDSKINAETIQNKYNESEDSKKQFNVVDYSYYTFTVNYKDVATDILGADYTDAELAEKKTEVLDAYKAAIADAKAKAEAMKALTDKAAFEKATLTHATEDGWDEVYNAQTVADADKPTNENLSILKAAIIADVVEELIEGKTAADDAASGTTAYGVTVTEAYAATLNTVKKNLFADILADKDSYNVEKDSYSSATDFGVWAFDSTRGVGDMTVIVSGDGKEETDSFENPSSSTVTVYLLNQTQHPNTEKSRNVAYMLFSTEDAAKKAIETLSANTALNLDAFEAFAEDTANAASGHTHLENYTEGTLGSAIFDEWVYDDNTALGSITSTALKLEEGTYAVAYYYGEGEEIWYVTVKNAILSENYEAYYKTMTDTYNPTLFTQADLSKVVDA